jgi:hypothetical protein
VRPEDMALLMDGFAQGTFFAETVLGPVPEPHITSKWLSLLAEHQAPEIARKAWN